MQCPKVHGTLLAVALAAPLMVAPVASAETSWRLYDLRDLVGLLPPAQKDDLARSPAPTMMIPRSVEPPAPRPASRPDPTKELMDTLGASLGFNCVALSPGVYGVDAEEADHATLLDLLEKIRNLYAEHYAIQVAWYATPPADAPAIGDIVTPSEPFRRDRLVVARRTPTEFTQVRRSTYVSKIDPVVATSAVGYASEIGSVESGLRASIMVGTGPEANDTIEVRMTGTLSRATMGKMGGAVHTDKTLEMQVELPEVSVRSIRSNLRIENGKLTVLNVVDGFEEGTSIVVAVSVRKLD